MQLINIDNLPESGLNINENIPLDALTTRMDEGKNNEIVFTRAPEVDATIKRTVKNAEITGLIRVFYKQPCALCANDLEQELKLDLQYTLKAQAAEGAEHDDVGIIYYDPPNFDLEDFSQETIILSLSPYLYPPRQSNGKCELCGLNFACETSEEGGGKRKLGDLLKGIKSKK